MYVGVAQDEINAFDDGNITKKHFVEEVFQIVLKRTENQWAEEKNDEKGKADEQEAQQDAKKPLTAEN